MELLVSPLRQNNIKLSSNRTETCLIKKFIKIFFFKETVEIEQGERNAGREIKKRIERENTPHVVYMSCA